MQNLLAYLKLMRLHRPIGIWLLLWPTLWALWIAGEGRPAVKTTVIFILGTVVMRSAGCVINDFADRRFDGYVARTRDRPLATGAITPCAALILFGLLCLCALVLVLQLNLFTIKLSLIALMLAIIYPFTKRITYWPQLFLGMAFAWAVPMAFAAVTNHVPVTGWLLFIIAVLWPLAYDTMYAMVDEQDDRKINIKSTAILFGKYNHCIIAGLQLIILGLLITLGIVLKLTAYYYGALLIAAGLAIYQQWLLKQAQPFAAFLNNNWFGAAVFLGLLLSYR